MNVSRFSIRGRAHARKLNSLINRGFNPKNIKCQGKELQFDEDSRNEKPVVAFCQEMCYDYDIIGRYGIKHILHGLLSEKGLFAGIVVSLALLIVCSMLIFDIGIYGLERVDQAAVLAAVKEESVTRFGLIYAVDKEALSERINAIEGVASAAVEIKGVRVIIRVEEELPPEEVLDPHDYSPVVALYDAVVTRIVVLSGTALVVKNSTVLKGQTLIAPYIEGNAADEVSEPPRSPIRADGIVFGRVWDRISSTIAAEETVLERTGAYAETVEASYILPSGSAALSPYRQYETERQIIVYNAVFPLKVTYTRYYELNEVTIKIDMETAKEEAVIKAYLELKARMPADAVAVRYWSTVKEVDNMAFVDVYLETEQRIDDGG